MINMAYDAEKYDGVAYGSSPRSFANDLSVSSSHDL